jgi:probable HAF family extracellular repeat protein
MARCAILLKVTAHCGAVVAVMSTNLALAQPIYIVTDLGTLGGDSSGAYGISNAGHVVGSSDTGLTDAHGNSISRAFLWTTVQGMIDLGTLGGLCSSGGGVNSKGEVVGSASIATGEYRAFLWLPESSYGLSAGMNDLGASGCSYGSYAHDINELGQVVGRGEDVFLWLPNPAFGLPSGLNVLLALGSCPYGIGEPPVAINDRGQIVFDDKVWLPEADYDREPGWSLLWVNEDNSRGVARQINNPAQVLTSAYSSSGMHDYASLLVYELDSDTTRHVFSQINPHGPITSRDMNNFGDLVYNASVAQRTVDSWWMSTELKSRIPPHMRWQWYMPYGINDHGQIVGTGRKPDGSSRAFLLTPIKADLDDDGVVESDDFDGLGECLSGPDVQTTDGCHRHDLDRNGRVDLEDFQLFQWAFGSNP